MGHSISPVTRNDEVRLAGLGTYRAQSVPIAAHCRLSHRCANGPLTWRLAPPPLPQSRPSARPTDLDARGRHPLGAENRTDGPTRCRECTACTATSARPCVPTTMREPVTRGGCRSARAVLQRVGGQSSRPAASDMSREAWADASSPAAGGDTDPSCSPASDASREAWADASSPAAGGDTRSILRSQGGTTEPRGLPVISMVLFRIQ
jgi:hypothetical protein